MVVVADLLPRRVGPGLVLRSLRQPSVGGAVDLAFDRAMGSVLNIDEFWMTTRHFAPHPHAGFSAVTYMLPSSPGGFRNRDSLGDDRCIAPGGLHATEAGAGMMHEEMPDRDGVECHGLQLFIKVRPELELALPRALHLRPEQIPELRRDGAIARVLFGSIGRDDDGWRLGELTGDQAGGEIGQTSVRGPLASRVDLDLAEILLHANAELALRGTSDRGAFAMVLDGTGLADGLPIQPGQALTWPPGHACRLRGIGAPLRLLVGCGEPLAGPVYNEGPFFAYSHARLHEYVERFAAGGMGSLADP